MAEPTPLRVGLWSETGWAFGRIARAIVKYAAPSVAVTIYDWNQPEQNQRLFAQQEWRQLDLLISNSYLLNYYKQTYGVDLPPELCKKTAIIVHFPRFDMTHFSEHVYYLEGVHYAGVSKETCVNLNAALDINNARWMPFGADTEEFSAAPVQVQTIRRIGFVGYRRDPATEYAQNKGQALFEEICQLSGTEPVFICGRQETAALYHGIDLLLCCSQMEAGPLGIFEAASCGVPVLTRRVGNAQEIEGIAAFDSAEQAALQIAKWNDNLDQLANYRDHVTREVRERWSMKTLIETHLVPWLKEIQAEPKSALVEPIPEAPPAPVLRLHMLAVPHTITRSEFSHCAFTGKVLRFAPMMRSRGYEVYHYGVETSESGATVHIDLFSKAEWEEYRLASYKFLHPEKSIEQCREHFANDANFIGDLANYSTPLYEEFNRRLRIKLLLNYRSTATDLVCLPFGTAHQGALSGLSVATVESGIGYPDSFNNYRVFESYAWLHHELGMAKSQQCSNYWFVVPNYFDVVEWPLSLQPQANTIGYFGRIYDNKGCGIIVEIAKRFPSVKFILCGQGDPTPYLAGAPNIAYKKPIHGKERGVYLGSLCALLAPTVFIEPFCGVAVEAQLCGTPVMAPDYGAQTETIEQGRTGLRCHTLADYCLGVRLALEGRFDRSYIRERAVAKYDMFEVAKEYDYVFRAILDVHNGTNGWYSPTSHIQLPWPASGHLDFVEIGTSDFDTETQRADVNSVGLCIEPIGLYLDRLPSWPHVKKIQKAISNSSGETVVFYVSPEDVERHGLPSWVRGCNTIAEPHPTVVKLLAERGLDAASLLHESTVPVQTLYECLLENGAQSIRYLKIDTEGHDCAILDQFALDLEANKRLDLRPAKIKFESNDLTPSATVDSTIARWVALGYRVSSRGYDTILELSK